MHNKAINKYKKAEAAYNQEKSPTEIVASLLNELTRSMGLVAQNIETEISTKENKSAQDKSKHFTRALVAIYSLQTSLDFDEGGSLAQAAAPLASAPRVRRGGRARARRPPSRAEGPAHTSRVPT